MLISYVLEGGAQATGMDELRERISATSRIAFKDVAGTGKSAVSFDKVPLDRATHYAAEAADVTLRLWHTAEAPAGAPSASYGL